jgi:peptide/nickel transport system permease protein
MLRHFVKSVILAIPTLFLVSIIGFALMRFDVTVGPINIPLGNARSLHLMDAVTVKNPIDPLANLRFNPSITESAYQQEVKRLGLDKPLYEQYWLWLSAIFQFHPKALMQGQFNAFFTPDFGKSFTGEAVSGLLIERAKNTILLNILTILFSWSLALPLGIFAALKVRTFWDGLLTFLSALGMAFPSMVLALQLGLLAVKTGILPVSGLVSPGTESWPWPQQFLDIAAHLVLPVTVLTVGSLAGIQRQMRSNLLEVLQSEYIRFARAKGLSETVVIGKHALRNALNPLITLLGFEFASLLAGSVLIESILNFPGLGALTYQAALKTDTNVMMAALLISSSMLILGNLLADTLNRALDPRLQN